VVLTIAGSPTDHPQMGKGWQVLAQALAGGTIGRMQITYQEFDERDAIEADDFTISAHRNTETLLGALSAIFGWAKLHPDTDVVLVAAAGWAAVLPGLMAAYLYYKLKATNIFVVGVAMESKSDGLPVSDSGPILDGRLGALHIYRALSTKQRRDLAALLSISELPGAQMLLSGDDCGPYFGAKGFERACQFAVTGEIPESLRKEIQTIKGKPFGFRKWQQAIAALDAA